MMGKRFRTLTVMGILVIALAACGFVDDTRETVNTVDEAVSLLQAIDDASTWDYITEGLDILADQNDGYRATLHLWESQLTAAGEVTGPHTAEYTYTILVGEQRTTLVERQVAGKIRSYIVTIDGDPNSHRYQAQQGTYTCANESYEGNLFRAGIASAFDDYVAEAIGIRLLSVVDEDDDDITIADRDATQYTLESKVPDALRIVDQLENDELQTRLAEADNFKLSGSLYLDDETGALLRFESTYDDLDTGKRTEFAFEITQWGDVPGIATPTEADIVTPCEPD